MTSSSHNIKHGWQEDAMCLGEDVENYFDRYETDADTRQATDVRCRACPVMRTCFAYAKFYELTGVWGGIYMVNGKIDQELNDHKTPDDWAKTYAELTK